MELIAAEQRRSLARMAKQRRWGLAFIAIGWVHLATFLFCYYLTIVCDYHASWAYLTIWLTELALMGLCFRVAGGGVAAPPLELELLVRRIWISYFVLAFNLGSLNTLRDHARFEFFPAMASLASFAFFLMTLLLDARFFWAVVVMFVSGLLMSANLPHAYLVFAVAWWLVLEGLGWTLYRMPMPISVPQTHDASQTAA